MYSTVGTPSQLVGGYWTGIYFLLLCPAFAILIEAPTAWRRQTRPSNSVALFIYVNFSSLSFLCKIDSSELLAATKCKISHCQLQKVYIFWSRRLVFRRSLLLYFFFLLLLWYAEAAALGWAESTTLNKLQAPWGVWCAELNLRARLLSFCIFVLQIEVDEAVRANKTLQRLRAFARLSCTARQNPFSSCSAAAFGPSSLPVAN